MHPFDLRAAILAKHAQRVVLIHFPLALFIAGVAFDYVAHLTGKAALASVAYYNFLAAAATSIPAVATGPLAWQSQLDGSRLHGILLMHLVLGATFAILMWLAWSLHFRVVRSGRPFAGISLAGRSAGSDGGRAHRTSWRISEWGKFVWLRPMLAQHSFWFRPSRQVNYQCGKRRGMRERLKRVVLKAAVSLCHPVFS